MEEKRLKLGMVIPENVWKIKKKLNDNGYKLYIVGGAVRDALMGKTPKDYDLATDATYETIRELFAGEDYVKNLLTIGEKFAINFLVTTDGEYELATFRSDVSGGRKSTVQYEKSLKKDVQRRDFTMNALAYDMDKGEVVDYVGGIDDIKNGFINAVGDAGARFIDDPLRKLRAVRFAARTGGNLSVQTEEALLKSNSMVDIEGVPVSMERRKEEFIKGLNSAKSVVNFLTLLQKFNLFEKIFESNLIEVNPKYFSEERSFVVLIAHIIQDSVAKYGIKSIEEELSKMKYSVKRGDKEIPRILFLLYILQTWNNKLFEKENAFEIFGKLKSLYNKISDFAREDLKRFVELNNIDKKFIDSLLIYFENVLSQKDKDDVAKKVGKSSGIEFGTSLKKKDFKAFEVSYYGLNQSEKNDETDSVFNEGKYKTGISIEAVYKNLFSDNGITVKGMEMVTEKGYTDMVFKLPGMVYYAARWFNSQNEVIYSRFLKQEVKKAQGDLDHGEEIQEKNVEFKTIKRANAQKLVDEISNDYKKLIRSQSFFNKISGWLFQ